MILLLLQTSSWLSYFTRITEINFNDFVAPSAPLQNDASVQQYTGLTNQEDRDFFLDNDTL